MKIQDKTAIRVLEGCVAIMGLLCAGLGYMLARCLKLIGIVALAVALLTARDCLAQTSSGTQTNGDNVGLCELMVFCGITAVAAGGVLYLYNKFCSDTRPRVVVLERTVDFIHWEPCATNITRLRGDERLNVFTNVITSNPGWYYRPVFPSAGKCYAPDTNAYTWTWQFKYDGYQVLSGPDVIALPQNLNP